MSDGVGPCLLIAITFAYLFKGIISLDIAVTIRTPKISFYFVVKKYIGYFKKEYPKKTDSRL